ncbi:MAG TPA: hypothetical protein VFU16_04300 [Solirubrobacterales bacterium]|nr:hypothetical protein [Solirubrobacterales bacterium]
MYLVDSEQVAPVTNRIDEFTAWGEFVQSWGWGVRDGAAELQTCGPGATPSSVDCLPGLEGGGAGQFDQPTGISIDSTGNLYVYDSENFRIQKFSSSGEFLLMIGGKVNATNGGNVCTDASGDTCKAGVSGTGDGEFEEFAGAGGVTGLGNYIGIGPGDVLFVAGPERIQEFDSSGGFIRDIPLPEAGEPGHMAVDPTSGDVYFDFASVPSGEEAQQPNVYRLDPETGAVINELPVPIPGALTADPDGNLWVVTEHIENNESFLEIIKFDSAGDPIIPLGTKFSPPGVLQALSGRIRALATNTVTATGGIDLFVSYRLSFADKRIRTYGPAPTKWPPPKKPPFIAAQYADAVGTEEATLKAKINPLFWDDTKYFVEYGEAPCSPGDCGTDVPAPPGLLLESGQINAIFITEGIELTGLKPNTTYHYRFIAKSSGGGPSVGVGGGEGESTFTTRPEPPPIPPCANDPFRNQAGAFLPDCRAYEMVSPIDKANGDILTQCNSLCFPARRNQAALSGGRVTYSSYRAFGEADSSPYSSQYLAVRGANGWSNRSLNVPQEGPPNAGPRILDTLWQTFSSDLEFGWFLKANAPVLEEAAVPDFSNLYRAAMDEGGAYRAFVTSAPPDVTPFSFNVELQGISANGARAVFKANGRLLGKASNKGLDQLYLWDEEGGLQLVSIRPNNTAALVGSQVGIAAIAPDPDNARSSLQNAISADGSRVFWTEAPNGAGPLYVWIEGKGSQLIAAKAEYVAANPEGTTAIYVDRGTGPNAGTLYEYDVEAKASTEIAANIRGVVGASEDAKVVYFVSNEDLTPGQGATAGQPNLYAHQQGGATSFVATLSPENLETTFSPIALAPNRRGTRITPDGSVLVFMNQAQLTDYENVDAVSDEPDAEVYRYRLGTPGVVCLSCDPTGARPHGAPLLTDLSGPSPFWGAAQIPNWPSSLHASRAVSEDGNRVFFESHDSLVLRDTNGRVDVYQWEAPGTGSCIEGKGEYVATAKGCISLISSGQSPEDSEFVDANSDGSEVYFLTGQSLVSQDPGLIDLYVAKVGGGFAPPPTPPAPCNGESCPGSSPQAVPPPPANFTGPGNQQTKPKPPKKCRKGTHKVKKNGKVRCVKNKKPAKHKRRAAR